MCEEVFEAQGQLPLSGEAVKPSAGDSSRLETSNVPNREETSGIPSKDPMVDTAEPRAALDGTEQEQRVSRGQRSGSGQRPRSLPPFHTMLPVMVEVGGPLGVHPKERRLNGGVCTYNHFEAGGSKD